MANQFLGEIRVFPCNFAPFGWAMCNGQLLPISQNTALFSLLGTNFGGNGTSNFALPNLQGSVPIFWEEGPGLTLRDIGEVGGEAAVTLTESEMPAHTHQVGCATTSDTSRPEGAVFGSRAEASLAYGPGSPNVSMSPAAVGSAGDGQPHNNMPPYVTLNFCIALQGVFPARS
jgi:microcystin-dependent protein